MEPIAAQDTFSVPVSPPARDSMEDADPSLTRKRPRLDSGSKETLAMPAEQTTAPNTAATLREQQVEMTIRSQPPSSSQAMDGANDPESLPDTTTATIALGEDTDSEAAVASTENGLTDVDEGSADSPPVIAIDDDDNDTMVGGTVPSAVQIEYDAELYFQRFPFAQHGNYLQAVHNIAQHFRDSKQLQCGPTRPHLPHNTNVFAASLIDGTVLPQVALWLNSLPEQPSCWKSYFQDKHVFWDEFAGIVHRVLHRRSRFGHQFCDDGQTEEDVFTSFFAEYFRVCAVLMQVDADTLLQWSPEETNAPDLLSCKHIRHITLILRREKPHLFGLLEREYGVDVHSMASRLAREFIRADGIKSLLTFANMARAEPAVLLQHATAVWMTQLINILGWSLLEMAEPQSVLGQAGFYQDVLQYFHSYDADLQTPSKVTDIGQAKEMITSMSALLHDLCQWDSPIAAKLADELLDFRDPDSPITPTLLDSRVTTGIDDYRQDPSLFPVLVTNAWKFKLLRKYVVKGRMELRVMSIGTMDNALVGIWKEYHQSPLGPSHPVMQYLAEFLLHERVTDYIISVDSHPQLISRSGNVVGFLVVTKRYSSSQTDAVWNTVAKSSDPRVVSATLTMLVNIFSLMDLPELVYLCTKFYELPIEIYSPDLLRILRELTNKMKTKYPNWSEIECNARPWNAVVRILQDTSPGKDTGKVFYAMHNDAYDQLYQLRGIIKSDERHDICRKCAAHIANRSPKATGSVRAINVLTTMPDCKDALFFAENPDVTRQILEETCAFVKEVDDITTNQAHALQYRLDLLSFLISHATEAIPLDLYQDIWDHLIGKYAQTNQLRDMAWSKFLEASKFNDENSFCKQLISSYVPNLEPQYYTPGLYGFVAAYKFPTTRRIVATSEGEKELLQIRGAELLWSMVLSAPAHTIEDHAAALLAARYLELGTEPNVALGEVEAAHVALVEQCMQELSSAYKVLRHNPGEVQDDQMNITPSEAVRQQNERRFTRTILFLKGLLMSIRKRSEFNRGRRSDSKVEPLDLDLAYGDTLEIKYQSQTEKQSILVGAADTLQDLNDRLCQATGYSKINLFARGQRISVAGKCNEPIADLGLADTMLLVQKAPGSEVTQPMSEPSKDCSVFETTLINQFDKLFACMDGDDAISIVVRKSIVFTILFC
jgi:ubiquitin carboxyl-terminal hydrolase 34